MNSVLITPLTHIDLLNQNNSSKKLSLQSNSMSSSSASKPITKIVTSKEWVLPPRPKPGRKPSADVPATKRKAQNRAAQRAFRERRANRVSELETKILEMERDRSIHEGVLLNSIKTLEVENGNLKKSLLNMNNEMDSLKKKLKDQANKNIFVKKEHGENKNISNEKENSVSSDDDDNSVQHQVASVMMNIKKSNSDSSNSLSISPSSIANDSCAVCVKDNCTCEMLGLRSRNNSNGLSTVINMKPQAAVPLKRGRVSFNVDIFSADKEVDFTETFSNNKRLKKMPKFKDNDKINQVYLSTAPKSSSNIDLNLQPERSSLAPYIKQDSINTRNSINNDTDAFESCGFCSDGTPCVCKEIANEKKEEKLKMEREIEEKEKAIILEIRRSAQKDQGQIAKCTGDPGTCLQCQRDPMSTLFCTTIANTSKVRLDDINDKYEDKDKIQATTKPVLPSITSSVSSSSTDLFGTPGNYRLPSLESLELNNPGKHFIPCADAYKTLSRHENFRRAGFDSIISNLQTNGMFVEVESVVGCLRELDRKFSSS